MGTAGSVAGADLRCASSPLSPLPSPATAARCASSSGGKAVLRRMVSCKCLHTRPNLWCDDAGA